jgi:hypothetical protein
VPSQLPPCTSITNAFCSHLFLSFFSSSQMFNCMLLGLLSLIGLLVHCFLSPFLTSVPSFFCLSYSSAHKMEAAGFSGMFSFVCSDRSSDPKHWCLSTRLHRVTSWKMIVFIFTAMGFLNLRLWFCELKEHLI